MAFTTSILGCVVLATAIFSPVGFALILPLENRFTRADLPQHVDGIICLGGGIEGQISSGRNVIEMANAGDRLYETALLAQRFTKAQIVYSGGGAMLYGDAGNNAVIAKKYLQSLGIDPTRIVLEQTSRNTDENVRFSKAIVKPSSKDTWVLVTSAFHMPRSIGIFRKHDWNVLAWPADYRAYGPKAATHFTSDYTSNLQTISVAIREWIGLISYRFSGKTDEILPTHNH